MRSKFASGAADIPWWLIMIAGIAAFIGGLLLLVSPGATLLLLEQLLGAYWLVTGILFFASLCIDRIMWGWKLITGILGILAGLAVLRHPLWSAVLIPTVLMIFLAIDALVIGVLQIIHAFNGGGIGLASLGILNIAFGLILWFNPLIGVYALPLVLGICAVIGGSLVSIRAFASRPQTTHMQPPGTQPA